MPSSLDRVNNIDWWRPPRSVAALRSRACEFAVPPLNGMGNFVHLSLRDHHLNQSLTITECLTDSFAVFHTH